MNLFAATKRSSPLIVAILALMIIAWASGDELLALSSTNLAFHMTVEHLVFFSIGALFAVIAGRFQFLDRSPFTGHRIIQVVIGISVSAALLAVWHYPPFFAAAVFHEDMHALQHLSFVAVGAFAMIAIRAMSVSHLLLFMVIANALMGLSGLLLVLSDRQVYFPYSIDSHLQAGNVMIILAIIMGIVILPAFLVGRSLRYELRERSSF